MSRSTTPASPLPAVGPAETTTPSVGAWLDVLVRMLRMKTGDRVSVRRELEAHLNDRVRDLVLDGVTEERAIAEAISELGETAELARQLNTAHQYPRRRRLMNATLLGAGLGVIGLGIAVTTSTPTQPPAVYETFEEESIPVELAETQVAVQFDDIELHEVLEYLSAVTGKPIYPHWGELEQCDIIAEDTVTMNLGEVPLRRVFELIVEQVGDHTPAAWVEQDGIIELASREYFDRRSTVLTTYDISVPIEAIVTNYGHSYDEAANRIEDLIVSVVSPEDWEEMGGSLAMMRLVGGRLFVSAPTRMHHNIAWVLEQLEPEHDFGSSPGR